MPRTRSLKRRLVCLLTVLTLGVGAGPAAAQENPVFVDDSTLAADVLTGLPGLVAAGNEGEAVRLLQRLLDEEADRLIPTVADASLFESVRDRVHRVLLGEPALLERYRETESIRAAAQLDAGEHRRVERSRLLTRSGFEAALRVAAADVEAGRFESARLALAQLERHPDRAEPSLASAAAALWVKVAAYLDRPAVWASAAAWTGGASGAERLPPVEWPKSLLTPARTPDGPGGALETGTLVGTPLCSVSLQASPTLGGEGGEQPAATRRSGGLLEFPYIFPLVAGDTVYTSDGLWISAWDRFTLTPRWQTKPRGADNERAALEEQYAARAYRKRQSRDVEEATTLAVHGRLLVAATGLVSDGGRTGDPRVHAIDRDSGRVLWSVYIDEMDPQLEESSTRGPAVFEGDVAVVAVRKSSMSKRFASAYLVGLDLADGSARWVRLIGSAGWLAYGGRGQWSDWPTLHEGVVYRVDELGVICAVEAGTGRFRWVRRLAGVESRLPGQRVPWAISRPVIDGETMLVLSPDREELLRIDLASGEIVSRRDAGLFGRPSYIFRAGDRLVAVSATRVATVRLSDAETAPIALSRSVAEPGIVGRVVAAGGTLLLPLESGVGVVGMADLQEGREVALDAPGNIVPLENQLLTVDNERLHSYLVWDEAAAILAARLEADPLDVSTAVTFAELAHRAGQPQAVLGPVDRALAAMGADPLGEAVRPAQRRLFALLLEMLQTGGAAAADEDVLRGAAERLGLVAVTPDEQATHLLARADLRLRHDEDAAAVSDAQRVISDPALASASWRRNGSTVRAELEALARLDAALRSAGPAAYAPFDAQAAERLAELRGTGAEAARFERLARTYPRARASVDAWLEAAGRHQDAGAALKADHALGRASAAVSALTGAGIGVPPELVGEVLGRRLTSLIGNRRLDAAAKALRAADLDWPGLALTAFGEAVARDDLSLRLRERLAIREARPRIEPPIAGEAALLEGWVLMRALDRRDAFARRAGAMLLAPGRVGLWEFPAGEPPRARWTLDVEDKPALIRFDPDRVLLYEPSERGGTLLAVDPESGSLLWRTEPLGEALAAAEGAGPAAGPEEFTAPLDERVSARDMLLAIDETLVAVVSRSGRAVGFDPRSGRRLWATRSACHAVHDVAAGDGVLVLGGAAIPESGDEAGESIVVVLDCADGEEISRFTGAAGRVRWVKVIPGIDRAVVGLSQGLAGLSLPQAQVDWVLSDPLLEESSAAWVVGERLFLQTSALNLSTVDAAAGRIVNQRVEVQGRLDLGGPIDLVGVDDRLLVLSPGGCAVLDQDGAALVGADAVEQFGGGLAQPALAAETVVAFEREQAPGGGEGYRFHILEAASGRAVASGTVAMADWPRRVALVDGVILVSAGDSTVALPTGGR